MAIGEPDTGTEQGASPDAVGGQADDAVEGPRRWRLRISSVVVTVIAVAGLLVLVYPSTAAWWSQYYQSQAIDLYSSAVQHDPFPGNAERLREAHEYNRLLSAGAIVVGAQSHKPVAQDSKAGAGLDYDTLLDSGSGVMARLKIPAISVDLPVYHGTDDQVLTKGVGHLEGTSLPVGGADTHAVLTAHRGLASATLFDHLDQLEKGDRFTIEVMGETLTYEVVQVQVIEPSDTKTLLPQSGRDLVTLVTCTPLGINSHRIVVTGERITPTPQADREVAGRAPDIPGFPWWTVAIAAGGAGAVLFVWRSGYPPRTRRS